MYYSRPVRLSGLGAKSAASAARTSAGISSALLAAAALPTPAAPFLAAASVAAAPIACTKTQDTQAMESIISQARQLAYGAAVGTIPVAQAESEIQALAASAPSQFSRATDWTGATLQQSCGSWLASNSSPAVPATSQAATIDCGVSVSPQQVISDLYSYVSSLPGGSGTGVGSVSTLGWLLIAGGAGLVIWLMLK